MKDFVSKKANNQLESYIKNEDKAWAEDSDGETRVYVVKDEFGEIALFFSIKCGLLVGENPKYKLTPAEREFVGYIVEAKKENDNNALEGYYSYGISEFGERIDVLFEIADRRIDAKKEAKVTGQIENWRVEKCVSAIELRHLCKNEKYPVPEELGDSDIKKLVKYYKNAFKFYESDEDDLIIVTPDYDEDCYGLIQEVNKLNVNREAVWHEFSDV
jgi:hypothetical protein